MYTYEDLKKAPVGTKITIENGEILVKCDEIKEGRPSMPIWKNNMYYRDDADLKDMDARGWLGKIIKIEEPVYTTVYENQNILDYKEKEYLSNVIKPFRNRVISIRKQKDKLNKNYEYLAMKYQDGIDDEYDTFFPNFKDGTMYKEMKIGKEYSLEELGIQGEKNNDL